MKITDSSDLCVSGGAKGSDLVWGWVAEKAGYGVIHFGFYGHKSKAPVGTIKMLSAHDLIEADPHCKLASESLKRHWPPSSLYVQNLLRRNWYQVAYSKSCYAISTFETMTNIELGHELTGVQVKGGTAWAVQMFIDIHGGEACPCYVFDQDTCNWFEWTGKWRRIYEPPKPKGIHTGIGTRDLNMIGKMAIEVLMDHGQDFHSENYPMRRTSYSDQSVQV